MCLLEEAPSKPSRQNVAPPQKPTRKKKAVVETNVEKVEVEVKKSDESDTRTGSVSSESTGRTTTQDIDHLLKGKAIYVMAISKALRRVIVSF